MGRRDRTGGYPSSGPASDLRPPPSGPAPGGRRPPEAEQVNVLRLAPDDRLVVTIAEPDWMDPESAAAVVEDIRETAARWAGIDPGRVLVSYGARIDVLRQEDPDGR